MLLSGNPIIKNKYTSDPTALVYNDEVYLYTGHDEAPPGAVLTAYGLAILLVRRIKGKAQPCFLFDKNYMVLFSLHAAVRCMTKTYLCQVIKRWYKTSCETHQFRLCGNVREKKSVNFHVSCHESFMCH
jgi:hypothetical protein